MSIQAVAIVSGGMDSCTMLKYYIERIGWNPDEIHVLSFNYGQRHKKELEYARNFVAELGCKHDIVDLTFLTKILSGSALTDDSIEVPEGHYAAENMKATVVPNRNMIMLSIAAGAAVAEGAICISTAIHAGDHAIYPDCRPGFRDDLEAAIASGNEGFIEDGFYIDAPFVEMTKTEIAELGNEMGMDWTKTWSCYKGGEHHCGECGTCVERREAITDSGVEDPTVYDSKVLAAGVKSYVL